MDVMEKLVELVDKARRYAANKCHSFMSCAECDHYGEHDGNCRNTYIAESLIADGVTVQEWISVKDRLPKEEDADITGCVLAIENRMALQGGGKFKAFTTAPNFSPTGCPCPNRRKENDYERNTLKSRKQNKKL